MNAIVVRAPLRHSAAGFDVRDGVLVVVVDLSVPDDEVAGYVSLAQGLAASDHGGRWASIAAPRRSTEVVDDPGGAPPH